LNSELSRENIIQRRLGGDQIFMRGFRVRGCVLSLPAHFYALFVDLLVFFTKSLYLDDLIFKAGFLFYQVVFFEFDLLEPFDRTLILHRSLEIGVELFR
jgi:hypothetical protein